MQAWLGSFPFLTAPSALAASSLDCHPCPHASKCCPSHPTKDAGMFWAVGWQKGQKSATLLLGLPGRTR